MPDLDPSTTSCRGGWLGPRGRLPVHRQPDRRQHAQVAQGRGGEASPGSYLLLGAPTEKYPDGQMFAGVRKGKRYVSYHLFSVYLEPGQLDGISPELRRRMQGKTCFNFTQVDDALFDELDAADRRAAASCTRSAACCA